MAGASVAVKLLAALAFTIITVPEEAHGQSSCNKTALNACVKLLGPFAEDFVTFSVDSSNITAACEAYTAALTCVNQTTGCTEFDGDFNQRWAAEQYFYAYVCGPGRTEYLANQPCFAGRVLQDDLANCTALISTTVARNATDDQVCQAFNGVFACADAKAASDCGNPAAGKFLAKLLIESYGHFVHFFYPCCILVAEETQKIGAGCPTTTPTSTGPPFNRALRQTDMVKVVMPPLTIFLGLVGIIVTVVIMGDNNRRYRYFY